MSTYYRVSDGALRELSAEQFAALAPNKRADLRLYFIDAPPTPSATQVVIDAGIVVGPIEAHLTYALRDKTAAELEADSLSDEKAQLDAWLTDIQAQLAIDNAARALLTNVQRINELEKDTRVLLKVAKRFVREAKRAA
jgi:hypothetical protein